MKITTRAGMAMVVALLMSAMACQKESNNKEAQLKALDSAYKSGVFTKEEYDSKKAALLGTTPAAPPATAPAVPPPVATSAPPAEAPAAPVSTPPVATPITAPAQTARPTTARVTTPLPTVAQPAPAPATAPPPEVRAPAPAPQAAPQPQAPPVTAAQTDDAEPAPLAGCQDAESRAGGPKGAQERFFPVSVEAVRKASTLALTNLDFAIHTDTGKEMEASKRRHLSAVVGAGGEKLILHFANAKQGGQSGTRVTAETKKSIVGVLAQKSWTSAVMAQISCNLRTGR